MEAKLLLDDILHDTLNDTKQLNHVYVDRLQDRRLQLANPDRARPRGQAEDKLARRRKRVKLELAQMKRLRMQHTPIDNAQLKGKQKELSSIKSASKPPEKKKAKAPLSRSQRKKLGLEDVDEGITYDDVLPLHELWSSYVQQLLNITVLEKGKMVPNPHFKADSLSVPSSGPVTTIQASLIKVDLCGAQIEVVRASNPSLCTLQGLVVKETERTIILVQPDRKGYKVIPKHNAIFAVHVPLPAGKALRFELHGNHMQHTLPARVTRKYKARPTIDF